MNLNKKIVKNIILLFISILIILSLCACGIIPEYGDYIMLEATHMNYGEHSIEEDYWSSTTYFLNRNGEVTCINSYNLSGDKKVTFTISEEDVISVIKILNSQKHAIDDNSAMDGSAWNIEYYDIDGSLISDYNGYIYNNKQYTKLSNILTELKQEHMPEC